MVDLDGLLPADHRARLVWSFVESLDLSPLYDQVLSRKGEADGRPPIPRFFFRCGSMRRLKGVGSARELERLAQSEAAYRLAGGVPLNYHGLADPGRQRGSSRSAFDESVTALIAEGLISLAAIAVDGTKVGASASKDPSGRAKNCSRSKRLSPSVWLRLSRSFRATRASNRRRQAAQERAAREVQERAAGARAALERLQAERSRAKEARQGRGQEEAAEGFDDRPRGALHALSRRRDLPRLERPDRRGPERGDHRLDRGDRPAQRCGPGGAEGRRHRPPLRPDARRLLVDTSYATSENIRRARRSRRGAG